MLIKNCEVYTCMDNLKSLCSGLYFIMQCRYVLCMHSIVHSFMYQPYFPHMHICMAGSQD